MSYIYTAILYRSSDKLKNRINGIIPYYHNYLCIGSERNWKKSFGWINSTTLGIENSTFKRNTKSRKWHQSNDTTIIIFTTTTNLKLDFRSSSLSDLNEKDKLNFFSSLMILPYHLSANIINVPQITGMIKKYHIFNTNFFNTIF